MKKTSRKLALHRDTVRSLTSQALREANGGLVNRGSYDCTLVVSCPGTCNTCYCYSIAVC